MEPHDRNVMAIKSAATCRFQPAAQTLSETPMTENTRDY
jgi:hypothetical protein